MPPRPADPSRWLQPPQGIERDDEHRYWLGDFAFPISVTGILASAKTPIALDRIEATRCQWEPRGTIVHLALELAVTVPGWSIDLYPPCWDYLDWVEPLLNHAIWRDVQVIASEFPLYALDHHGGLSIAGTFDLAWEVPGTTSPLHGGPCRTLVDLKTQANAKAGAYDTRPQLGGYLTLAAHHGLIFDSAATLWARPGRCKLATHSVGECLDAWNQAVAHYRSADPSRSLTAAP